MIKELAKSMLQKLGFEGEGPRRAERHTEVARPLAGVEIFFQAWKNSGRSPGFIIDVGANHGDWTRSARAFFPDAKFVLVEPQKDLAKYSQDLIALKNVRWLTAGISDQEGTMMLSLPGRDDSATFSLSVEEAQRAGIPQEAVPVTTLDSIVGQEGRIPEIVKIDAEGFDLRALRGASSLLGNTEVFLVECGVCCRAIENSVQAVCAFMDEKGYRVFDISDIIRSPKNHILWLAELVFVSKTSRVWDEYNSFE